MNGHVMNTENRLGCMSRAAKYWKKAGIPIKGGKPALDELYVRVIADRHIWGFVYDAHTDTMTIMDSNMHGRTAELDESCRDDLEFALGRRVDPATEPPNRITVKTLQNLPQQRPGDLSCGVFWILNVTAQVNRADKHDLIVVKNLSQVGMPSMRNAILAALLKYAESEEKEEAHPRDVSQTAEQEKARKAAEQAGGASAEAQGDPGGTQPYTLLEGALHNYKEQMLHAKYSKQGVDGGFDSVRALLYELEVHTA